MEGEERKRARRNAPRSLLRLAERIPQRDVRQLIWRHLGPEDREVVRHAHNSRRELDMQHARALTHYCCGRGYLSLLRWVDRVGRGAGFFYEGGRACIAALVGGHVPVLKYMRSRVLQWPIFIEELGYKYAARTGQADLCRWLCEEAKQPVPRDCEIELEAAHHGHVAVLEWLVSVRRLNAWPMVAAAAAAGGQLKTLQWLRAHGCNWDEYTIERAEEYGHLNVIEWARANGAPEF